ncbi:MAG: lipopolysaccharide biosynthesis protein [Bacteroidetes bacterium]|nr:lipopolysaccharide biosynthesis protein [Bacteroidota bacterium]
MSLRNIALKGMFWTYLDQFGGQIIQFAVSVVLARILLPEEFGIIAILMVFIAVSNSLVTSGFGQALIRKKDVDELDYSSVFYVNLIVSIIVYGLLYLSAPLIANFYEDPRLVSLTRVIGLGTIIGAFSLVQTARLTQRMDFKTQMTIRIPSLILGGAVGIWAALNGYSYWSLVMQMLTTQFVSVLQLWIRTGWYPKRIFSLDRVRSMFAFGSRLMLSGLLDTIYKNIYVILIGKYFSQAQVGFYNRANNTKQLPVSNISNALTKVTYPLFAKIQDDDIRLKAVYKQIMQQVIFWIAPILIGSAVVGEPLFRFVFTEKWLPAVPYFQVLCIVGILYPLNSYNLNVLKVKGRSDLFLRLEVIKKVLITISLFIALPFGVIGLVWSQVALSIIAYGINSYYSGYFINYGIWEQVRDISPTILNAIIMGAGVWLLLWLSPNWPDWLILLLSAISGAVLYFLGAKLMRLSALDEFWKIVKR